MDGFYPYHEMNAYLGLIAMALAVVGAGGRRARPLGGFWVILVGLGAILMLGKFTFLFDQATGSRSWAARASRCGSTSGSRWASPRWRPSASSGWRGPARSRSAAALILAGVLVAALDPDHGLRLRAGLDRAESLEPAVSPRPVSLAGPRADARR